MRRPASASAPCSGLQRSSAYDPPCRWYGLFRKVRSLDRRVAPVDEVVATGHERRLVGEQEADERRDLFRLTEPAQGMPRDEFPPELLRKAGDQRSLDVGRSDAVDAQPLRSVFGGGVLGEPDDAVLRRGIGPITDRGDGSVDGSHVDDRALSRSRLEHRGDLVAHSVEDTAEVDVDHALPVRQVGFARRRRCAADSGVVHRIVERSIGLHHMTHDRLAVLRLGGILDEGAGGPAGLRDLGCDPLRGFAPDVGEDDLGSLGRERLADRLAESGAAAGDDCDLSAESTHGAPRPDSRDLRASMYRVLGWGDAAHSSPVVPKSQVGLTAYGCRSCTLTATMTVLPDISTAPTHPGGERDGDDVVAGGPQGAGLLGSGGTAEEQKACPRYVTVAKSLRAGLERARGALRNLLQCQRVAAPRPRSSDG